MRPTHPRPFERTHAARALRSAACVLLVVAASSEARGVQSELVIQSGHTGAVTCMAFSNKSPRLVTGSADGTVVAWDLTTGQMLLHMAAHTHAVGAVAADSQGTLIASASRWESSALIHDLRKPDGRRVLRDGRSGVGCVALSPNGRLCATGSEDGMVAVWDLTTPGKVSYLRYGASPVRALAFHPDGHSVVGGLLDGSAIRYSTDGDSRTHMIHRAPGPICSVAFDRQGLKIYLAFSDLPGRWIDLATGCVLKSVNMGTALVDRAAASPDARYVLSILYPRRVVLWDVARDRQIEGFGGRARDIRCGAFSPEGRRVALGWEDGFVDIRKCPEGVVCQELPRRATPVVRVEYDSSAKAIRTDLRTRTKGLRTLRWDLHRGVPTLLVEPPEEQLPCVAVSTDGRHVLVTSLPKDTSSCLGGDSEEDRVCQSTDPASENAFEARLIKVHSGQVIQSLRGHRGPVVSVALSHDNRMLTGSLDQTARLWAAGQGTPQVTFRGHMGAVNSVAFGPGDRLVLTGSDDGTARLWDSRSGRELIRLVPMDEGTEWLVVTHDGLCDGSAKGLAAITWWDGHSLQPCDPSYRRPGLLSRIWAEMSDSGGTGKQ